MTTFQIWLIAFVPAAVMVVTWSVRKEITNFLNRGK
jgi:hypothetical protein